MKIGVLIETSSADKNAAVVAALEGRGHQVFNIGMKKPGEKPELLYIHTGLMSAVLLNTQAVDYVVGGCGTGQGYLNAVMQYPGVFCGHILNSLDAWLFTQINGGNCISLALNQGYGWAGDVNLKFIFDRIFSVENGGGYPAHRKQPQKEARELLFEISRITHRSFSEILTELPAELVRTSINYPGMPELINIDSVADKKLREVLIKFIR